MFVGIGATGETMVARSIVVEAGSAPGWKLDSGNSVIPARLPEVKLAKKYR